MHLVVARACSIFAHLYVDVLNALNIKLLLQYPISAYILHLSIF
jgi:hypothetical protein